MNYQTKPVPVQALQFNGENINECMAFCNTNGCRRLHVSGGNTLKLSEMQNDAYCNPGDYIVLSDSGFYSCYSEEAFNRIFEAAPPVTE